MFRIILLAVLGACFGSFAAVLSRTLLEWRVLPRRSACDLCRRQLSWWELIPIFSWLGLRGRCRSCDGAIIFADWAMELLGAMLFAFGAWRFTDSRDLIWWLCLVMITLVLFYIDWRWMIVPRAFAIVAAFVAFMAHFSVANMPILLLTGLLGAIFYFFLFAVSRRRWVGDGDIGLGLVVGLMVGDPVKLGITLLVAHVMGGIVAAILLIKGKKQFGDALPMGVFLLPAAWIITLTLVDKF